MFHKRGLSSEKTSKIANIQNFISDFLLFQALNLGRFLEIRGVLSYNVHAVIRMALADVRGHYERFEFEISVC